MSACSESKPRWERRKEARPQELLSAALDLFVDKGYAATRLEDVARCAGVSKGTLYLYFTNKEELFKAVVRDSIVPHIGAAEDMLAEFQGHSGDLLRAMIFEWWTRMGESKASGIVKLIMAESGNFPEMARFYQEEVIDRGCGLVRRLLMSGIDKGHFRPVDPETTTHVLIAPILMLMMWQNTSGPCHPVGLEARRYVDTLIDVTLHGLMPPA